jgi:hypothetical protein
MEITGAFVGLFCGKNMQKGLQEVFGKWSHKNIIVKKQKKLGDNDCQALDCVFQRDSPLFYFKINWWDPPFLTQAHLVSICFSPVP